MQYFSIFRILSIIDGKISEIPDSFYFKANLNLHFSFENFSSCVTYSKQKRECLCRYSRLFLFDTEHVCCHGQFFSMSASTA